MLLTSRSPCHESVTQPYRTEEKKMVKLRSKKHAGVYAKVLDSQGFGRVVPVNVHLDVVAINQVVNDWLNDLDGVRKEVQIRPPDLCKIGQRI